MFIGFWPFQLKVCRSCNCLDCVVPYCSVRKFFKHPEISFAWAEGLEGLHVLYHLYINQIVAPPTNVVVIFI